MTRFINYLNEDISNSIGSVSMIWPEIEKKCGPFLNDYKKANIKNTFLLSGRRFVDDWFEGKVRKNRRPLDTPKDIHDFLDEEFKKKFGIKARSESLFCVSSMGIASNFGKIYVIFPIGKYEIIWGNVKDLTDRLGAISRKRFPFGVLDRPTKWNKKNKEIWWSYMKMMIKNNVMPEYKKGDLKNALYSEKEIMLVCDKYIAVKANSIKVIYELTNLIYNQGKS